MRPVIVLPLCCYLCEYYFEGAMDEGYCELSNSVKFPLDVCNKFKITRKFIQEIHYNEN